MKSILENYLKQLTNQNNISLSVPPKPEMGDFAFGVFPLAKVYRKNPNEIAQELLEKISSNKPDFIEKVEQA
jgi:arginyl-tRNA synthetase